MADFKVGDVVRLKSGSPSMTVTSVERSGFSEDSPIHAYVCWFNDKGEERKGNYPLNALERDDDD